MTTIQSSHCSYCDLKQNPNNYIPINNEKDTGKYIDSDSYSSDNNSYWKYCLLTPLEIVKILESQATIDQIDQTLNNLLADIYALLEKDPLEAYFFLKEAIQSTNLINFKPVVDDTLAKLLSINVADKAYDLIIRSLYTGIDVDKEIILQTKSALETDGKNTEAEQLSKFCE